MEEGELTVCHISAPLSGPMIRTMRRAARRGKPVRLCIDLAAAHSELVTIPPRTLPLFAQAQALGYTTRLVLGMRGGPLEVGMLVSRGDRPSYALFCRHEWEWYRDRGTLHAKPPCLDADQD